MGISKIRTLDTCRLVQILLIQASLVFFLIKLLLASTLQALNKSDPR